MALSPGLTPTSSHLYPEKAFYTKVVFSNFVFWDHVLQVVIHNTREETNVSEWDWEVKGTLR